MLLEQIKTQQSIAAAALHGNSSNHGAGHHTITNSANQDETNMNGLLQELEMIDNVRPLRHIIIESVRGMPTWSDCRTKKDPV